MIHGTGSAPGGSLEADFGGDWAITVFLGTRQSDPVPKPLHQRGTGRDPEDWTGCRTGELADEFDVCGRQGPGRWWKGPNRICPKACACVLHDRRRRDEDGRKLTGD